MLELCGIGALKTAARIWYWSSGNIGCDWYSVYLSFFRQVAKLEIDWEKWIPYETLSTVAGPRFFHPEFAVISDRPDILHVDTQDRIHCEDGPAMHWRDGTAVYAVHGVRVPAWIIEKPNTITVKAIEDESNAEIRRVMIDKYGASRYLEDSDAKIEHSDEDMFGRPRRLYRKDRADDTPLVMARVLNATKEPDGTHKEYWVKFPDNMKRVDEAVAWSFYEAAETYKPDCEDGFGPDGKPAPMVNQARQGDIFVKRLDALPKGLVKVDRSGVVVFAQGSSTGNSHLVRDAHVTQWRHNEDKTEALQRTRSDGDFPAESFIVVEGEPAFLEHGEHGNKADGHPTVIPPGIHVVRRQRESVDGQLQNVED